MTQIHEVDSTIQNTQGGVEEVDVNNVALLCKHEDSAAGNVKYEEELTMSSASSPDVEKLIHNYEFENQHYVKEIEKEKTRIRALESQMGELEANMTDLQHATSQLDADTKIYHRQFTQNRDNIESLKKTSSLLQGQEQALKMRKENLERKGKEEEEEHASMEAHYSRILEDYLKKYESFVSSKALKSAREALQNAQERLQQLWAKREHVREMIDTHQKNKGTDFQPYKTEVELAIKVAELKVSSSRMEFEIDRINRDNQEIERNIHDKKELAELRRKKEAEEKEKEEALKREKKRQLEEEMNRRKEALMEEQRKREELQLKQERDREEKERAEREQRELEEKMMNTHLQKESVPLQMNPPSQPPPRRSPLKVKMPSTTYLSPRGRPLMSPPSEPAPLRRSPPKMIIPLSPSMKFGSTSVGQEKMVKPPRLQVPASPNRDVSASINVPIMTRTPSSTSASGIKPSHIPVLPTPNFEKESQQLTTPVTPTPAKQPTIIPRSPATPAPADVRVLPNTSPQKMEIQDRYSSAITGAETSADKITEIETDSTNTEKRYGANCETPPESDNDECMSDPRTPGGSMDIEKHLEKLKTLQSTSPGSGFYYTKRSMFEENGAMGTFVDGPGMPEPKSPSLANLFGAGDSLNFSSPFKFGPSSDSAKVISNNVFASPPSKGGDGDNADFDTTASSASNMFGDSSLFSFSNNSGTDSVFNMFGDVDSKEEASSGFSFSFGSADTNTNTENTNFSLF